MTYQDPDPLRRDLDPKLNPNAGDGGSGMMWGWIAGIAALLLVLVFLFGSGTDNTRTTDIRNPSTPMASPPPANNVTAPRTTPAPNPPETTGQGQQ
jgi:hypothetical protein